MCSSALCMPLWEMSVNDHLRCLSPVSTGVVHSWWCTTGPDAQISGSDNRLVNDVAVDRFLLSSIPKSFSQTRSKTGSCAITIFANVR